MNQFVTQTHNKPRDATTTSATTTKRTHKHTHTQTQIHDKHWKWEKVFPLTQMLPSHTFGYEPIGSLVHRIEIFLQLNFSKIILMIAGLFIPIVYGTKRNNYLFKSDKHMYLIQVDVPDTWSQWPFVVHLKLLVLYLYLLFLFFLLIDLSVIFFVSIWSGAISTDSSSWWNTQQSWNCCDLY